MTPRSARLKVVLELAERNEKKAMDDLAAAKRYADEQRGQLANLETYHRQYMDTMKASMSGTVDIRNLQSNQSFITQVETAINHQVNVVRQADKQFDQVKQVWLALREKKKGVAELIERRVQEERMVQEKKESKQIEDDMTARRYKRR